MSKINYVQHMQAILSHKHDNDDLSIQDCKDLFSNLMSIAYLQPDSQLNDQICANAAVLLAAHCNSYDYQVHVDLQKSSNADYQVQVTALKPNEKKG